MVEVVGTSNSNGTRSNPIIIENDSCHKLYGKGKGLKTPTDPSPSKPNSP